MYLVGAAHPHKAESALALERAKELVYSHRRLSSRDALHLAVMERHGVREILSFDRGFDLIPGIRRLPA